MDINASLLTLLPMHSVTRSQQIQLKTTSILSLTLRLVRLSLPLCSPPARYRVGERGGRCAGRCACKEARPRRLLRLCVTTMAIDFVVVSMNQEATITPNIL